MKTAEELAREIVLWLTGDTKPERPEVIAEIRAFANDRERAMRERCAEIVSDMVKMDKALFGAKYPGITPIIALASDEELPDAVPAAIRALPLTTEVSDE
jgi:hypothetical protein